MLIINDARFCCWSRKKYDSQTLLEECKYEIKKIKMENLVNDDLEPSSSGNETDSDSNNESNKDSDNESIEEFAHKYQN